MVTPATPAARWNPKDGTLAPPPERGQQDGSDVNTVKATALSGPLSSSHTFDVPVDANAMQAEAAAGPTAAVRPAPTPERQQVETENEESGFVHPAQGSADDATTTTADIHQEKKVAAESTLARSTLPASCGTAPQRSPESDAEVSLLSPGTVPLQDEVVAEMGNVRLASTSPAVVASATVGGGGDGWEDGQGVETTPARPRQLAGTFEFCSVHGGGEGTGGEGAVDGGDDLTPTEQVSRQQRLLDVYGLLLRNV